MGFPVGYTEVFLPKLLIHTLTLLGLIKLLISSLFRAVGLSDFLEPDIAWPDPSLSSSPTVPSSLSSPAAPSLSSSPAAAALIRELLPVVSFADLALPAPAESCAVCLYEFEREDQIRRLTNCRHIFHRSCLDRWMDHDQRTCPLCRTPFVPDDLQEEFQQRLWAASGICPEFYGHYYSAIPGL